MEEENKSSVAVAAKMYVYTATVWGQGTVDLHNWPFGRKDLLLLAGE